MILHVVVSGAGQMPWIPMLAALGVVIAAGIAAWVALRTQQKTALIETVTAERATWRTDLRNEMANLATAVLGSLDGSKTKGTAFHRARIGILLRINPAGRLYPQPITGGHNLDRVIDARLRSLAIAMNVEPRIRAGNPTRSSVVNDLAQLEHAVQELLKQEWEGSKEEATTGKLKRTSGHSAHY